MPQPTHPQENGKAGGNRLPCNKVLKKEVGKFDQIVLAKKPETLPANLVVDIFKKSGYILATMRYDISLAAKADGTLTFIKFFRLLRLHLALALDDTGLSADLAFFLNPCVKLLIKPGQLC